MAISLGIVPLLLLRLCLLLRLLLRLLLVLRHNRPMPLVRRCGLVRHLWKDNSRCRKRLPSDMNIDLRRRSLCPTISLISGVPSKRRRGALRSSKPRPNFENDAFYK